MASTHIQMLLSTPAQVAVRAFAADDLQRLSGGWADYANAQSPTTKRQTERACVAQLLQELRADGPPQRDEKRRPVVEGWAHTSISHTEGWAVVAHGERPLGVDIERPRNQLLRIAPRIVQPDEALDWLADPQDLAGLTQIWGAKEAVYKRFGAGVGANDISIMKLSRALKPELVALAKDQGAAAIARVMRPDGAHHLGVAWSAMLDPSGAPMWIALAWDLE